MPINPPTVLLEDPAELAELSIWTEDVYRDLLDLERGDLTDERFRERHCHRVAILVIDISGFTEAAMNRGELGAFLRILNVHKVCVPVLREHGAQLVRAFADDLVALFGNPYDALDAALAAHARIAAHSPGTSLCAGIGFGDVFAIGPNRAMGDEMNRASKLGEDTAVAHETLLTENAYRAVADRPGTVFEERTATLPFPYFSATG